MPDEKNWCIQTRKSAASVKQMEHLETSEVKKSRPRSSSRKNSFLDLWFLAHFHVQKAENFDPIYRNLYKEEILSIGCECIKWRPGIASCFWQSWPLRSQMLQSPNMQWKRMGAVTRRSKREEFWFGFPCPQKATTSLSRYSASRILCQCQEIAKRVESTDCHLSSGFTVVISISEVSID